MSIDIGQWVAIGVTTLDAAKKVKEFIDSISGDEGFQIKTGDELSALAQKVRDLPKLPE